MIKDLDYDGILQDVCDELNVSVREFKLTKYQYIPMNVLWARIIAYRIVSNYGYTREEVCDALELNILYVGNLDKLFTELSEEEEFRRLYAVLKMSCNRKYKKTDTKYGKCGNSL